MEVIEGEILIERGDPDYGDFTYAPEFGFLGTDTFYWQVSEQYGYSNIGLYAIDVGGVVVRGRTEQSAIASR